MTPKELKAQYNKEYYLANKEKVNAKNKEYIRSKKGLVCVLYSHQKRASKIRNHVHPLYSKEELGEWLFSQPLFHELYSSWVKSGYKTDLSPSIDRPDDYLPYSISNIQLMTWKENRDKYYRDKKNGVNNKHSKIILQFDLNGNFIQEFYSGREVERRLGINHNSLYSCCNKRHGRKTAGGFIWKYKKLTIK